jgi:hypothetical protein
MRDRPVRVSKTVQNVQENQRFSSHEMSLLSSWALEAEEAKAKEDQAKAHKNIGATDG